MISDFVKTLTSGLTERRCDGKGLDFGEKLGGGFDRTPLDIAFRRRLQGAGERREGKKRKEERKKNQF